MSAALLGDVHEAYGEEEAARAAVCDDEAPWGPVYAAERKVRAAEEALKAFEAAHPELAAARAARRAAEEAEALGRAFRD